MTRTTSVVTVAVLGFLLITGVSAVGSAADSPAATDTTTTTSAENETTTPLPTPTVTPTATPTSTPEEDKGSGVTLNVGNSTLVDSSPQARDSTIVRSLGPQAFVSDVEWRPKHDVGVVTISTKRPLRLTFTDSSAIDPDKKSGTFRQMSATIPSGTHRVVVPATLKDCNQLVTITGGAENIWLSNGCASQVDIPTAGKWSALLIGGLTPFILGAARMKYRGRKRRKDGAKRVF